MTPRETPDLDHEQRAAVERTGQDVCVVAGPGSGKTRVLTERFHWVIERGHARPSQILTITFTEKAADEIKARLARRAAGDDELCRDLHHAYVSTIHGFCSRLLREQAIAAGLDVGFTVLGDPDGPELLAAAAERALDELFFEQPDAMRELMEAVAVSSRSSEFSFDMAAALAGVYQSIRVAGGDLAKDPPEPEAPAAALGDIFETLFLSLIPEADWRTPAQREERAALLQWLEHARRGSGADALALLEGLVINLRRVPADRKDAMREIREKLIPRAQSALAAVQRAPLRRLLLDALRRLDRLYRAGKQAVSGLDFTDLEEKALELLDRDPALREKIRNQFQYILMDELQDTNPLQWEILERIRRPDRFFAVGDINQSIYGFRDAEPRLFEDFERALRDAGKQVDRITGNYRSRQEILDAVTWLTGGREGIRGNPLQARKATPGPDEGPYVEILVANPEDPRAGDLEARCIASRAAELVAAGGVQWRDIAVLARKAGNLETISAAFREAGVPHVITGGARLYETREARDIAHLLHAIANVRDEIHLAGVLRSPVGGLDDETLLRLHLIRPGNLWAAVAACAAEPLTVMPAGQAERVRWIHDLLRELRESRDEVPPDRAVLRALDGSGYLAILNAQARANIGKVLAILRERWETAPFSAAEAAALLDRLRAGAGDSEAPPDQASDAVRLMSMHAAKGLEFPIVFAAALHSQTPSEIPPICYAPAGLFGVKWRLPGSGKAAGDPFHEAVREAFRSRRSGEEWRLLYVAMTRAERRLILSWDASRRKPTEWVKHIGEACEIDADAEGRREIATPSGSKVMISVFRKRPAVLEPRPVGLEAELPPAHLVRPSLTDQHDSVIPVTHVASFLVCPRRYYLEHYLGLGAAPSRPAGVMSGEGSEEVDAPEGGAGLGAQVHEILAGQAPADPLREAVDLVAAFRRSELAARMDRSPRVEREFDFLVEIPPVLVGGRMDAWFEDGGGVVLVDYKTDRFDPEQEPDRLRPYLVQLQLYALALERLAGRLPAEALLAFLRSGKLVPAPLDGRSLARARGVVASLAEAQHRLDFPLDEGDHCWSCPFHRRACPAR